MWKSGIIVMAAVIGEGVHCSSMTSSSPPPLEESELMNVVKRSVCRLRALVSMWHTIQFPPAWILMAHL